jgi:pyrimidine-nucleoside phosphorylase
MKTIEDARELSRLMVSIGALSGRKVVALLSDMNQPLGEAVGNALELKEAIDTLHGKGPRDFREHCLVAASHMLVLGHKAANLETGRKLAEQALVEGRAWETFRTLVRVQGGDVSYIDHPEKLAQANLVESLTAPKEGYLKEVNAQVVGETSVELGAGRAKKEDAIDHAVGILVHHKVGDHVNKGEAVFTVHANDASKMQSALAKLQGALQWSSTPCDALPLFYGVVE